MPPHGKGRPSPSESVPYAVCPWVSLFVDEGYPMGSECTYMLYLRVLLALYFRGRV